MPNTRSQRHFVPLILATVTLTLTLAAASFPALVAASDPTPTPYAIPVKTAPAHEEPFSIVQTAYPNGDQSAASRKLIAETTHYQFYVESDDVTADTFPDLAERAETVYADVVARLDGFTPDAGLTEPITVIIQRPKSPVDSGCGVRGLAAYDDDQVIIFADSTVSEAYFWGVLAHETAHMIHGASLPGFGNHRPLTEGIATWASASYWAAWMGADSLDDLVRSYLDSGDYLSLVDNYEMTLAYEDENCIYYRDILYSEWASFAGWLIREYGFGRFGALMDSDPVTSRLDDDLGRVTEIHPADFEGIYGQALNQLEARWLDWLQVGDV
jgi:hypothetical protein